MSMTEIALVLVVALILFGPEDLPVIARAAGKIVAQIRKYTGEISKEFKSAMNAPEEMVNQAFKNPSANKQTDVKTDDSADNQHNDSDDIEEELLTYEDPVIQNDTRAGEK